MKKRILFTIVFLSILFSMFFWLIGRKAKQDFPAIQKSGRLVVVTDSSSFGISIEKDSVSGFQYEIVKAFADKYGFELLVIQQNDAEKAIQGIIDGEYNIMAGFIPQNMEYKAKLALTIPLLSSGLVLIQKIDTLQPLLQSQLELCKDTVFLSEHSIFKARVKNLAKEMADTIQIKELPDKSLEQLIKLVAEGKIKNTICPTQLAVKYKLKYENIDISLPVGFTQDYSWGVNFNSNMLLDSVNVFLTDFIGSTEYWEIYRKYQ